MKIKEDLIANNPSSNRNKYPQMCRYLHEIKGKKVFVTIVLFGKDSGWKRKLCEIEFYHKELKCTFISSSFFWKEIWNFLFPSKVHLVTPQRYCFTERWLSLSLIAHQHCLLQALIVPLKEGNRLYSYHLSRIYSIPQTIQPTTSPCQAQLRPAMAILYIKTAPSTAALVSSHSKYCLFCC